LVKKAGIDRLGHIVADTEIGIGGSEVLAIPCSALSEGTIGVGQLVLARK
jgi:hypothetical protein